MTGTYCGALPVLPAQRAPSLLGSRCRLRPLYVPPSTCYGFPAKVCQVASPCRSPDTESLRKRSRCPFSLPTWHGIPAKAFQVSFSAFHLARNSRESVPGVFPCRPPATESPQKCARCLIPAVHLPQRPCRCFGGSLNKTPFAAIMMAGYHVSGR